MGGQFWDGRSATLAEQAKQPFLNKVEMANPDKATVIKDVRNAAYAELFKRVYGPDALKDVEQAYDYVADAIADFESSRQLNAFTSKYDYYLVGKVKLTKQEQRGLKLYEAEDKGNCAACHPLWPDENDGTPPLFTDFTYDNLGVPRTPHNPFYSLPRELNLEGKKFVDIGLAANPKVKADGRAQQEIGKVKVPTLRNIELTAWRVGGFDPRQVGVHVAEFTIDHFDPRCLGKRLKSIFAEGFGDRSSPAVKADRFGRPGVSYRSPEWRSDQPDGCTGETEVFEKMTAAEPTAFIRVINPIQFFFGYDSHLFSFHLMVARLFLYLRKFSRQITGQQRCGDR